MSNIDALSREGLADRLTWNFGSETLPLAPIHKVSVPAPAVVTVKVRVAVAAADAAASSMPITNSGKSWLTAKARATIRCDTDPAPQ